MSDANDTSRDSTASADALPDDVLKGTGFGPSRNPAQSAAALALEQAQPLGPDDFYMEGPYLVFTAAYHLRRGSCCNSNCRHCPYK